MKNSSTKNQIINGYNLSALPDIPKSQENERGFATKGFYKAFIFVLKTIIKIAPFWTLAMFMLTIFQVITPIAATYFFKQIVDLLIDGNQLRDMLSVILYTIGLSFIASILPTLKVYLHSRIRFNLAHFHIDTILNHLADLPASLFYKPEIQEKLIRISFYETALIQFTQIINEFITKPLIIITNVLILWSLSPYIVIAISTLILLNTYITIKFENRATSVMFLNSSYSSIAFEYNKFFDEAHIEELKIFRLKKFILARLKQIQLRFESEQIKILTSKIFSQSTITFLWSLTKLGATIIAIIKFSQGIFTVGDFTFYHSILAKLQFNSSLFSYNMASLQRFTIYILDMMELLEQDTEIQLENNKKPKHINFNEIIFDKISFTYPNSKLQILDNLNLKIKAGEKIAIVGKNGAGKTTLINILLGLYPTTNGNVILKSKNSSQILKDISMDNWRYSINYVPQDFSNLPFSIHETVAYGDIEKLDNKSQILKAIDKADLLKDLLKKIPHNKPEEILNTYLGKKFANSQKLSGGQYQKLAIARAFMNTKAPLAIFDEPSSKLDVEAEEKLFTRLIKETGNKTVIFISHRYSTVRDADRILVIEDGKISENGSHKELMNLNGYYARMFKLQAGKYK